MVINMYAPILALSWDGYRQVDKVDCCRVTIGIGLCMNNMITIQTNAANKLCLWNVKRKKLSNNESSTLTTRSNRSKPRCSHMIIPLIQRMMPL